MMFLPSTTTLTFFLLWLCSNGCTSVSESPGLKIRVTDAGLSYASGIAGGILAAQIRNVSLPDFSSDISGGPGKGSVSVTNLRIPEFSAPTFSYILLPPDESRWSARGGYVKVWGDWAGWYKVLVKIRGSGKFTVVASGVQLAVGFRVSRSTLGQPQIVVRSCSAQFRTVDISISGGFVGWLVNLFSNEISNQIRRQLNKEFCTQAKGILSAIANAELQTLSIWVQLDPNLSLDYRLIADPNVTAAYVDSLHRGRVSWRRDGVEPPFTPAPIPDSSDLSARMLYLWVSDYVLNSLLWSAHVHNGSQVSVNRAGMPELAKYLRTSCGDLELCVGHISSEIGRRYPDSYTELHLRTLEAPLCTIDGQSATIKGLAEVAVFAQTANGSLALLFVGNLHANVAVTPQLHQTRLTAKAEINTLDANITESTIGTISGLEMDVAMELARPLVQFLANRRLQEGFQLPMIDGVTFTQSELKLVQHAVQLGVDLQYRRRD